MHKCCEFCFKRRVDRDEKAAKETFENKMDLLGESTTGKSVTARLLKLVLKVEESSDLEIGAQFEILPGGMIGSSRGVSDCITYAGKSRDISELVNDIKFGRDEEGVGDRHFMTKYDAGNF